MGYIWKTPYSHSFHIKRTKRDRGYLGQVRSGEIRPNEGTKIRVQLQREEKLKHKNKLSGKSYPYDETGYFKKKKREKRKRKRRAIKKVCMRCKRKGQRKWAREEVK
ncbi:hypothetical protein I7I52_06170 [Histoplasma capsulatum]|uniref:Uncharacterized protein n=1 Tax=Ajellomyces capsulatus TaxID=5037 RepID=A0A8H7YTB8_AJECA|nr:hypothetical protein I7I52_06170 [Histoplasma capsulatum]